jgi:hypothetical protein
VRCHSAARLAALQSPSLLDTAAALPHVPGSPRLGVLQRLRSVPARSAVGAPSPSGHAGRAAAGKTGTVPLFTVIRSAEEEPGSAPAASPRLPRSTSPWSPSRSSKASQRVPCLGRVRAAPGPYPPDLSRSRLERRKRRFLAYSFPPRSPDLSHLAVLAHPGFVGAACHPIRHHPDQAAPSFTALLRQDGGEGLPPPLKSTAPHGALGGT